MEVYVVQEHSGSYEDYRCDINHIFTTDKKAQQYIDDQTVYWEARQQRSKMCNSCPMYFNVDLEDVKNKELFIQKAKQRCAYFTISNDREYMTCHEYLWDEDIPKFKRVKYEIE